MQRVRNNIHKARKHTQKARKDVRKIRVRMMRDFYEKPLSEDMLEASGKCDMNRVKEAMTLLAVNNEPMPLEWKDHQLTGNLSKYRECHVKGDLLLVYEIKPKGSKIELITFVKVCTHSEIFGR